MYLIIDYIKLNINLFVFFYLILGLAMATSIVAVAPRLHWLPLLALTVYTKIKELLFSKIDTTTFKKKRLGHSRKAKTLRKEDQKLVYECGFDIFADARAGCDVHFYVIAIIFIIFDMELGFIFPWAACWLSMTTIAFHTLMFFLFLLIIGFVYEYRGNAFNWIKR